MAAHQAPPSLGFSRQEHRSGLPFPSPMPESEKWKWSRSVVSDSQWPHGLPPTRLLRPWDFPSKGTGVGCHCLLWVCTYVIWSWEWTSTGFRTLECSAGRLQSMGSQRARHDWATSLSLFTFMHWRRKWQPTPVFLPGESQGRGSLVGCHLWGRTELDTTKAT